jgi:hypothetical protein
VEFREIRTDHVAKAAGRIPVDEQYAPTSEIRKRNRPAIQVGKPKVGDLGTDRQTLKNWRTCGGAWRMAPGVAQAVLQSVEPQEKPSLLPEELIDENPEAREHYEEHNQDNRQDRLFDHPAWKD